MVAVSPCSCCCQVSALPVVNDQGQLLDIYARSDITKLCKGNAYSRLQWEDVTVSGTGCGWLPCVFVCEGAAFPGTKTMLNGIRKGARVSSGDF